MLSAESSTGAAANVLPRPGLRSLWSGSGQNIYRRSGCASLSGTVSVLCRLKRRLSRWRTATHLVCKCEGPAHLAWTQLYALSILAIFLLITSWIPPVSRPLGQEMVGLNIKAVRTHFQASLIQHSSCIEWFMGCKKQTGIRPNWQWIGNNLTGTWSGC